MDSFAIDVDWNYKPTIVKEITHVEFQERRRLRMSKNRIESIERLCKILMSLLDDLYLRTC